MTAQLDLFSAFAAQVVPTMPAPNAPENIPFLDKTLPAKKPKPNRVIENKLAELRRLHDELNTALYQTQPAEKPQINSPADAAALVSPFIQNLDHEELWVILLNTRSRVLKLVKLYSGSLNSASIRVGEVFKDAIAESASAIIIAHNHPSGDPLPSPEDVSVTRAIWKAGKFLDIELLDHVVIGYNRFVSLKTQGLGFNE